MDPTKLVISLLPILANQLATPAIKEIAKIWKVDQELEDLLATYLSMNKMLEELQVRFETNHDSFAKWWQELEGYLYDTEDVVDLLNLGFTTNDENENPIRRQILKSSYYVKPLLIPDKIVQLRENLEKVSNRIQKLLGEQLNSKKLDLDAPTDRKTRLSDVIPFLPGTCRDLDKQIIIEKLINCAHSTGVSIVGIDGLGKTSLARAIMVDETIKTHFPLLLSASVSGNFHITDIVKELVANYSDSHRGADEILRDSLKRERSLIILDDLWSLQAKDWQTFKRNYLGQNPAWKILITTPSREVAEETKSFAHDLGSMTHEDCKELIIKTGELSQNECEILEMDLEVIAKKCQGLPIIANEVGLELSKKQTIHEKKEALVFLKNCNLWEVSGFKKVFLLLNSNVLKMPLHLKRCFSYCSLFPPHHEFNKDDLIQFWEVEGFIQPHKSISLKEIARKECFDNILSRSIIHPSNTRDNQPPIYKMLEFRHCSAQHLASKAFCRIHEGTSSTSLSSYRNIRHLSLTNSQNIDKLLLKKIEKCKGLRTFLLLHQNQNRPLSIPCNIFENLQSLRLLDLSLTKITTLSNPSGLSKHLRYLDLSNTDVDKLPTKIHSLHALQVLKLKNCPKLHQLPRELSKLISLTHLHFDVRRVSCSPPNLGNLAYLEVLESFYVGTREGYKISELSSMQNLTKVEIFGLDYIKNRVEAEGAMLVEKPWLRTLVLEWSNDKAKNANEVFDGLQPHADLNNLQVRNYGGKFLPEWLTSPRCQLVCIYLDNFPNCEVLPSLGQLPMLKNLVLSSFGCVTTVDSQFCGEGERVFPCLELLEFRGMDQLSNWTGLKGGDMPCLRSLKIVGCPELCSVPLLVHLSCLINLEINNCPALQFLPELPSTMNGESGKLIIADCGLVKERCQNGGDDWSKIKDILYVEIHAIRIQTRSSCQDGTTVKDQVSMNEHQSLTFDEPILENNVSQSQRTPSEDQPTLSYLQLTDVTINHTASETHNIQDEVQRNNGSPPATFTNHDQDDLLKEEHSSNPVDGSCISQTENSRNNQPPPGIPKLVDEILTTQEYQTQSTNGKLPKSSPSLGWHCGLFGGCFSKEG